MAEKITFSSVAQIIQEPRERYLRQSNIGTNWNEVRIGMLYTVVNNTTTNSASAAETVTTASNLDWITMGLKDSGTAIPGSATAQFIGWMGSAVNGNTTIIQSNNSAVSSLMTGAGTNKYGATNGTSILTNAFFTNSGNNAVQIAQFGGANYASFLGIKFVVVNKGASNQTINISISTDSGWGTNGNIGPYAITQATALTVLRTNITGAIYEVGNPFVSLTWNASGAALPLPNSWFCRFPFLNNRLRMAAHECILIS